MADSMELEMGVRVNGADDDTTSHMVSAPLASKKVKASYVDFITDDTYLSSRGLHKSLTSMHLIALGVGSASAGVASGWNLSLSSGFGALFVTLIISFLHFGALSSSFAEMSASMPFTGGSYAYARASMGHFAGLIVGLVEQIEYMIASATTVYYIGIVWNDIFGFGDDTHLTPLWWLLTYIIFCAIHIYGYRVSTWCTCGVAILMGIMCIIFNVGAWRTANFHKWAVPDGWFVSPNFKNTFEALPNTMLLFVGYLEAVPMTAEECLDPQKSLPKGFLISPVIMFVMYFVTFFSASSISPGISELASELLPLYPTFNTIFGGNVARGVLAFLSLFFLLASFNAWVYSYGRQIFAMSRSGYIPEQLSVTLKGKHTPYRATIFGSIIGFIIALLFKEGSESGSDSLLMYAFLNGFGLAALINYTLQMICFIILRVKYSRMTRHYTSPVGIYGAVFAICMNLLSVLSIYSIPKPQPLDWHLGIWVALGLIYFWFYSRKHLRFSPEESFSLLFIYAVKYQRDRQKNVLKGSSSSANSRGSRTSTRGSNNRENNRELYMHSKSSKDSHHSRDSMESKSTKEETSSVASI